MKLRPRYASVICGLPVVIVVSLDYDIPDKAGGEGLTFIFRFQYVPEQVALSRPDLYVEGPRQLRWNFIHCFAEVCF